MPIDVTKEDIWQAASTLAQEEKTPTIMNIRSKLGGGSPHGIAFHLADWKAEHREAEDGTFYTDWEMEELRRKALEQEQIELMEEIDRLDADLQRTREAAADSAEALHAEQKARDSMKSHGERWSEQLKEARDTVEKLTAENKALQVALAALKEQAAYGEEMKIQVEKLQGELADLAVGKGAKGGAGQKNANRSRNARSNAQKAAPAKKSEIPQKTALAKEPEIPRKTFPPTFGVAQKIDQLAKPR
uniref:Replication region DNA-binding N-term n=1 Tax=Candidatus Kentrum sp. LPFa TaxID=2126335 RepID=A0A450W9C4_9GAMM|nr:MAG: replication region DNA-binding N-term [Candidatus Kentron sp. LPFa]